LQIAINNIKDIVNVLLFAIFQYIFVAEISAIFNAWNRAKLF